MRNDLSSSDSMKLAGQVAVVTGANRGIGRALVHAFAARGADVALLDVALDDDAAILPVGLPRVRTAAYRCDIRDEQAVSATFARIAADFGRLDILVNNAGILHDALLLKVKDGALQGRMSLEQWQAVIDVNLTGTFLCGREAATHMVAAGHGGVIINISSIARCGNIGQTNYSAAKAGVEAMSVVWAKELARYGIRAASIAPGATRTDMTASMRPEALEHMSKAVPLRRLAEIGEIAHAAVFIAENDYFTGRCLELDGGLRL